MSTLLLVKRDDCMLSIKYRHLSLSRKPCGIVCLETEMLDYNSQLKIE